MKELQKTAILGTAHILLKVLLLKYNTFNMESNNNVPLSFTIKELQQCIYPRTFVCFMYTILNHLHRGE
jgi:hypothetical protein